MRFSATKALVAVVALAGCAHVPVTPLPLAAHRQVVVDEQRFRAPLVLVLDAHGNSLPQILAPVAHPAPDLTIDQLLLARRARARESDCTAAVRPGDDEFQK